MNGYGAVGDARKRMHPGDAAQHRANLEFSARERAEERVAELEDKVERLRAAYEAMCRQWQAMQERAEKAEAVAVLVDELHQEASGERYEARAKHEALRESVAGLAEDLAADHEWHDDVMCTCPARRVKALPTEGAE